MSDDRPQQKQTSEKATKSIDAKRGVRRDREFRRYAEVVVGLRPAKNQTAVSSQDFALTAYAQLVALRLDVKRVLISLFDADHHYIVAEATRSLSLQHDDVHSISDALWFGVGVLDRQQDFSHSTLRANKRAAHDGAQPRRYFEVPDLLQHHDYATHRFVVNEPYARSYAGVPLISPTGFAIGTLSFLDDKVRRSKLDDVQVAFMQDIGWTIMSHLETHRLVITHARGLQMIKGLSRFVEGDAGFDDASNEEKLSAEGSKGQPAARTVLLGASNRTRALHAASTAERSSDARRMQPSLMYHVSPPVTDTVEPEIPPLVRQSLNEPSAAPLPAQTKSTPSDRAREESISHPAGSVLSTDELTSVSKAPDANGDIATKAKSTSTDSRDLQECLLSTDVKHSFQRAAAIINRAMNVSGTLFLDASVGEFGRLRNESENSSGLDSDSANRSSGVEKENDDAEITSDVSPQPAQVCRQIASAYNVALSGGDSTAVLHNGIPERFLKSLMRRFPHGKIWTFDPNGYTSSDEYSDSSAATDRTSEDPKQATRSVPQHGRKRKGDGTKIAQLFPGVRSLCLLPMYDQMRERYLAGAIVWTYDPIRVLSVQEDQNYLGAFCDVIMAEVGRLDAQAEARTKTNFLSSISHEIRSPLHGILGGVECLQDKDNAVNQEEMLEMIDASGRTLLDIINHLLEHAHANPSDRRQRKGGNKVLRNQESSTGRYHSTRYNTSSHHQPLNDLAILTEEVIDTALWSTPKPTPLSDQSGRSGLPHSTSSAPIKVVLVVDSTNVGEKGWWFRVNSGAWKRIVQNLVANSIKYTDSGGYLKVSLSAVPPREGSADEATRTVELACLDSGRGMSNQYLNHNLWEAFTQEDSNSQGTGLGLSLVRGIVKEMGGSIDVQSSKGVGTAFRIKVPLHRGQRSRSLSKSGLSPAAVEWLATSKYAMVDFDEDGEGEERSTEARDVLKSSIAAACNGYDLRVAQDDAEADIFIILEHKARSLAKYGARNDVERAILEKPVLILCHSVASSRALFSSGVTQMKKAVIIGQPLGPRKLTKALAACFERYSGISTTEPVLQESPDTLTPLILTSPTTSDVSDATLSQINAAIQPAPVKKPVSLRPRTRPPAPRSGLSTLLVDDNHLNLSLLREYMNKNGHDFKCASDGQEAVDRYKEDYKIRAAPSDGTPADAGNEPQALTAPITIVFMDLTMPVMSGLEATRQIRAYERSRGIHQSTIVALTAMESAEVRQEAFGSGVDLFLTKPLKLKELTEILMEHMKSRQDRSGRIEQTASSTVQ